MIRISILILTILTSMSLQAQNLDQMNETKRRETLLQIAKATVMDYGPDFYREFGNPEIIHGNIAEKDRYSSDDHIKRYKNRSYYIVKYFYDKTKEDFPEDYAAMVYIWGDSGKAYRLYFGSSNVGYNNLDEPAMRRKIKKAKWKKRPAGTFDPRQSISEPR